MKKILYILLFISLLGCTLSEDNKIDNYVSDTTLAIWAGKFNKSIFEYTGSADTIILGVDNFRTWSQKINSFIDSIPNDNLDTIIYGTDNFETWRTKYNYAVDSSFNPDAYALFARMDSALTYDEKLLVSDYIDSLQLSGVWDNSDCLYEACMPTEQQATLNWIGNNYSLTNVNSTTFTAYEGFTGNGTNMYLNTGFNPTLASGNYTTTSAIFGISLDSVALSSEYHGVTDGSVNTFILPSFGGNAIIRVNSNSNATASNTNLNEIFVANRQNSSQQELYVGKSRTLDAQSFNGIPNREFYILCRNNGGTAAGFSSNTVNGAIIGGGLTQAQVEKYVALKKWFTNQMRVLGLVADLSSTSNTNMIQLVLNSTESTTITQELTRDVNSEIFLNSYDTLICTNGLTLNKSATYCNVLINRGALSGDTTRNIYLDGVKLVVNGFQQSPTLVPKLRGQLAFYRVNGVTIKNFECLDLDDFQFCIEFAEWRNVLLENGTIIGDKDALDFLTGSGAVIRNYTFANSDDAIFVGGVAYPSNQLGIGDVSDIRVVGCTDLLRADPGGQFMRIYPGSWGDWTVDSTYQTGDLTNNNGNIYSMSNANGTSLTAANAPVHTSGEVTGADGITWDFIAAKDIYSANVDNIEIDSTLIDQNRYIVHVQYENSAFNRTIYPGTDDSSNVTNITVKNCSLDYPVLRGAFLNSSSLVSIDIENNYIDSAFYFFRNSLDITRDSVVVNSVGNTFDNTGRLLSSENVNNKLVFFSDNETYNTSSAINNVEAGAELRAINFTIPFDDLSDVNAAAVGDTCRNTTGLNVWNGSSWDLIP